MAPAAAPSVLIWASVLFPPLAVYFKRGVRPELGINVCFTLCGFLPGVFHALWIVNEEQLPQ
jgi:uncharacterized membrane protein YqaE (UPF0057 family)